MYLFFDIETTDLDGVVLEAAGILTTDELKVIGKVSVIKTGFFPITCWEGHRRNGLLTALEQTKDLEENDPIEKVWRELNIYNLPYKPHLAGFSVHFDRKFLTKEQEACLTHRHLDLTSFLLLYNVKKKKPKHRALPDCLQALKWARKWRSRYISSLKLLRIPKCQE